MVKDIFSNVYSDSSQSALKYLKDIEVNIWNLLVITGDFNIRDNLWDPLYPHHFSLSDDLFIIADCFNLGLSVSTNWVPTRYSNNIQEANSVIDFMFLQFGSSKMDNHLIHPNWRLTSDHTYLTVVIPIIKEHIQTKKCSIVKNSNKEYTFIKELTESLRSINTLDIGDIVHLDSIINEFTSSLESIYAKNLKVINIMVYSKSWWNTNCSRDLNIYRTSKRLEDWKQFKRMVKNTKCSFFDLKIQKISNRKWEPWELINWVHKHKLPAIEAVKYNRWPCLEINNLWHTLHSTFNMVQDQQINEEILNKIPFCLTSP